MPTAPALVGKLAEFTAGRRADVLTADHVAPGHLELTLRADPPPGGWRPGHEVQFRVTRTKGRRYTVRAVGRTNPDHIQILIATEANGPGTAWLSRLRAGETITALAGRHRPLRGSGPRRLYLGDGSTLGTIDACVRDADSIGVIETRPDAVAELSRTWPRLLFLAATDTAGGAALAWLTGAGSAVFGRVDGAVLLGHAQTIQRERRFLLDRAVFPRQAVAVRPFWADGKEGL
jgi:NADPH-dependent ferric siderophore reductase